MQLPRDGQEYCRIQFEGLPVNATVQASLDRATWLPTVTSSDPQERMFLVRGPASTQTMGAVVAADSELWVRVADVPEDVIRNAGTIWLE